MGLFAGSFVVDWLLLESLQHMCSVPGWMACVHCNLSTPLCCCLPCLRCCWLVCAWLHAGEEGTAHHIMHLFCPASCCLTWWMQPLTVFFLHPLVAAAQLLKLSQSLQHTPSTLIALLECIRTSSMYPCTHQSYEHRRLPLIAVRIRRPLGLQLPAESICLRRPGAERSLYC
jgi:hypothetical protein